MENAVQALKMAFAILIFVAALTLTFFSLSQTKKASDVVFHYIDREKFHTDLEEIETENGGRKVGVDTIISNLYKIEKETIAVKIEGVESESLDFDLDDIGRDELLENIKKFKKDYLDDSKYIETFSEVALTGIYKISEDGTEINFQPGVKKIYITYTKKI